MPGGGGGKFDLLIVNDGEEDGRWRLETTKLTQHGVTTWIHTCHKVSCHTLHLHSFVYMYVI